MKDVSEKKQQQSTKLDVKLLLLIIMGLILLLSPIYLRIGKPLLGSEPYFYQRIIEEISMKHSILAQDNLSFTGRAFTYDLGPIIFLYFFSLITNITTLLKFLPAIFGIITLIISYFLLKKLQISSQIAFIASAILALSPAFLSIFTKFTAVTITVPLIITASYLAFSKKKIPKIMSSILFLLIPFFGFWESILAIIILTYFMKNNKKQSIITISLILFLLAIIHIPHIITTHTLTFHKTGKFSNILFDISKNGATSIFTLILAVFGLSLLWKRKYENMKYYVLIILLLILSSLYKYGSIYFGFMICFLAAKGFVALKTIRWESYEIKKVTLFFLLCGVLFSGISFIGSTATAYPDEQIINSLTELKSITEPNDIILSHNSNSNWINYIAQRKTFINEQTAYAPELSQKLRDTQTIFSSRDIEKTEELLKKHKINYNYLTANMKQGLVWKSEDQGLLFVSKYSKFLELKSSNDNIEIWRVKQ